METSTSTHSGDSITYTYWLSPEGHIETYMVGVDANGEKFAESGTPAPRGTELDSEGVARELRKQLLLEKDNYDEAQKAAVKSRLEEIEEHRAKVDQLVSLGLDVEAVRLLLPEEPPVYRAQPYVTDPSVRQSISKFGLSEEQVNRVIAGWT